MIRNGKGGFAIIFALKDIITQVLLAGSFAILFPLGIDKYVRGHRNQNHLNSKRFDIIIIITSAVSILLCFLFSSSLYGVIPLNLAILPLFIGVLYGGYKSGLPLAALYLACDYWVDGGWTMAGLVLRTGLLLYPLLLWLSRSFRTDPLMMKMNKLWLCLLPALLFIVAASVIEDPSMRLDGLSELSETGPIVVILFYILVSFLAGGLLLYLIEFALEKLFLNEQVTGISEKYLREEEKLQQVMDVTPLCIISVDRDAKVTSVNEMMLELIKNQYPDLSKHDVLGQPVDKYIDMIEKDYIHYRIQRALRGIKMDNELIRIGTRMYYTSMAPLLNTHAGDILGAVLIVQDITELENLRSELGNVERLSLVGQMAASITHEIRNPMAVVRGFLQLMKEKSPDSLDHYYRIVMEELDRANGIINDFLSLAQNRISEKEQGHLHRIIHDLSPLLWADANLRGQTIDLKLDENVPELKLNTKEIKQLLLNLSRNGMEAMEEKGQLTIITRLRDEYVELIVQDTGTGIPKSKLDRLFEPFFTTKTKGTGLGLALCLSIVERHHGKISVESEESVGTVFTVKFPLPFSLEESV